MQRFKQFLVNFTIRAILGMGIIFFANQYFMQREMELQVGINAVSFVASGLLGMPGVAMLYGIVAIPFL